MYRLLLVTLLCLCSFAPFAQKRQGLSLTVHEDKWMVKHRAAHGETLFLLSRRYHVPPAMLAEANGLNIGSNVEADSIIFIPLGPFNYLSMAPASAGEAKAIYYKIRDDENLSRISRRTGVSQRVIQDLNNMPDNDVSPGQVLQIGWVRYDGTQMLNSGDGAIKAMEKTSPPVVVRDTAKPVTRQLDSNSKYKIVLARKEVKQPDGKIEVYLLRDTIWADTLGPGGKVYMTQTNNEQNVAEEKGTVVFYEMPGKVNSTKAFFALHNSLPKGTAVRVYNPGTNKFVFVKVIGPMPDTKQYHNAIMGVGAGAKAALGVTDEKAWCELKYRAQ